MRGVANFYISAFPIAIEVSSCSNYYYLVANYQSATHTVFLHVHVYGTVWCGYMSYSVVIQQTFFCLDAYLVTTFACIPF